jgi:acyl-CoA dehydrogenase
MTATPDTRGETVQTLLDEIERIATEVAGPNADDVDQKARFPDEAIAALKEAGALSALVPTKYGGGGASVEDVAAMCLALGRRCAAAGMVFAMHQIQVACLVRHGTGSAWFEDYLRELSAAQRLIASATSEAGTGGDMSRSIASVVELDNGICSFEKQAPTVSYGAHADDVLTTLRRSPDADGGEQVVVLTNRDQTQLEQSGTWDPFGMRGTCSPGFTIRATFAADQILPQPFSRVSAQSMVPLSHIFWSHLWLGIATDAFDRARAFVRASSRQKPGEPVPAAVRLSHLLVELSLMRAEVGQGLREFIDGDNSPNRERLSTMGSGLRFNTLKIAASEQAPRICQAAMSVCGIVGFKNDTPFSVGRHLRDAMSGPLMIANERIHQTNAALLLVAKDV